MKDERGRKMKGNIRSTIARVNNSVLNGNRVGEDCPDACSGLIVSSGDQVGVWG